MLLRKLILTANNSVNEVEIKFGGQYASGQIHKKRGGTSQRWLKSPITPTKESNWLKGLVKSTALEAGLSMVTYVSWLRMIPDNVRFLISYYQWLRTFLKNICSQETYVTRKRTQPGQNLKKKSKTEKEESTTESDS